MIVFITVKHEELDSYTPPGIDIVTVLGAFHTLNQAQEVAECELGAHAFWMEGDDQWEFAYDNITYTITRHVVPKAVFSE